MITKQHVAAVIALLSVMLAVTAPAYLGPQIAAGPTCPGTTLTPGGAYTFSYLHVDAGGIMRDADNCEVVLTGFDWQSDERWGVPDGTGETLAVMQGDFNSLHSLFGSNVMRIYLNSYWWLNNYAEVSPVKTGSGTCGTTAPMSCPDYPSYIGWLVQNLNNAGMYVIIASDTMWPEPVGCTQTYFGKSGVNCAPQAQSDYDYNNAPTCTGTGCTASNTTGCADSSGTAIACRNAPYVGASGCPSGGPCPALYANNPYICKDGGVITSTITMMNSLTQTYANNPGVIFETWNEMASGACGRNIGKDADSTTANSSYEDYRTYGTPCTSGNPCHQPDWNTSTVFGAWYDHNATMIDVIKRNDPKQVIMISGQGASADDCPLWGDPSKTTCSAGGAGTQPTLPLWTQSTAQNMFFDYHVYPTTYMAKNVVQNANPPGSSNANWELNADHAHGIAAVYGELGGTSPTATYYCDIFPEAKRQHVGQIYFMPVDVVTDISAPPLTLRTIGQALQADYAYLRGNPADPNYVSQPLDIDNTTVCTGY